MPPRPTRPQKNCPTCPNSKPQATVVRTLAITSQSEGERLWKHVLFGTMTCVAMIEGYADMAMPGDCVQGITILRDRLDSVLTTLKSKTNVPKDAASPVGSTDTAAPSG